MDTNLTKIEVIALEWVSMDYESIPTILENVVSDLGSPVTELELFEVLSSLREKGVIESYSYAKKQNSFIPKSPDANSINDTWWLVTCSGLNLIKNVNGAAL